MRQYTTRLRKNSSDYPRRREIIRTEVVSILYIESVWSLLIPQLRNDYKNTIINDQNLSLDNPVEPKIIDLLSHLRQHRNQKARFIPPHAGV